MDTRQRLAAAISGILPRVTALRHDIHAHPEMALEERRTSALVRELLSETAADVLPPFLETDVVALLSGPNSGPCVTLRADMDALPLCEATGLPYASETPGTMHACGHDGHTAVLAGTALVLNELKDVLPGTVRFVFQPGEEVVAAGRDLVEAGALKNPPQGAAFALHAWPGNPVGTIASRPGALMAAAGFFTIRIEGKGGHGSRPEAAVDPVLAGARVVEALQTVVARRVSALDAAVVSVCRFTGGTNGNIIPDSVELEGTIRYLTQEVGQTITTEIERLVHGTCKAMGANATIEYTPAYLPTVNDETMVELAQVVVTEHLGPDQWIDVDVPCMGGEDFAYYIDDTPGAMVWLGMGEDCAPIHNPHFNFRDEAIENGIRFMSAIAIEALQKLTG
ncbi:MAG: amidohydrolase [Lentisphaerae bacterium]|jgi:amidohydrolase|nr:amidohydrolase [Lentisphaerota bacterium]MBT4821610.1 amidohydrolase [Lentisphaerota bacterium]MBT5608154.1 amidohydrolase [Lentisphaerota bacterium]MBT7058702.1 amidohydrolase [Lentisphaerota bacterium]MBT7847668.1 amidohydrolase [Lentisphaerota bacterium]